MRRGAAREVGPTAAAHTETLDLEGLAKGFAGQQVLRSVDLSVRPGEFFTLLGPSGCGKTTLLRIISGLERADSGRVLIGGRDVSREPAERRPFNMVFQSYALFPHLTVAENVAYGLRVSATPAREVNRKVREFLALVDLADAADRAVTSLSGGQRQRVALARALVNEPTVLLLDEPLGALDLQLRKRLQEELRSLQQRVGTTFVYVTHDQEEALSLSDRIAVMRQGQMVQVGTPEEVYGRPATRFVAEFVGEANLVEGELLSVSDGQAVVRVAQGSSLRLATSPALIARAGSRVTAAIRPEDLEPVPETEAHFSGQAVQRAYVGTHYRSVVELPDGTRMRVSTAGSAPAASGPMHLRLRHGRGVLVDDDVTPGSGA